MKRSKLVNAFIIGLLLFILTTGTLFFISYIKQDRATIITKGCIATNSLTGYVTSDYIVYNNHYDMEFDYGYSLGAYMLTLVTEHTISISFYPQPINQPYKNVLFDGNKTTAATQGLCTTDYVIPLYLNFNDTVIVPQDSCIIPGTRFHNNDYTFYKTCYPNNFTVSYESIVGSPTAYILSN